MVYYRIGSAVQLWGPFDLKSGSNMRWSSKDENIFADEISLPGYNVRTMQDAYDVVVILGK